ncbi:MAG TPA: hypothetical protein PK300_05920 [Bacillota bacterium]|nr:hypothetical protein [Bacillota bacterium]
MGKSLPHTRHITWIRICIFLAVFCCVLTLPVFADTGTYKIKDYAVEITPQPDGSWVAYYTQEWEVLSGSIPWVTVGLPNANYEVISWTGAATQVKPDNQGAWSGVYVQLDNDYRRGESFNFGFKVIQQRVAYPKEGSHVEFSFTPGWYDNSPVERMTITLDNPWSPEDLRYTSPTPTEQHDNKIVWVTSLRPGQRFNVDFAFSPEVFTELRQTPRGSMPGASGEGEEMFDAAIIGFIILFIFILLFLIIISAILRSRRRYYRPRRGIYYGTPKPFVAPVPAVPGTRLRRVPGKKGESPKSGDSKKSGSGGGGFGGRSSGCYCVSCACACVSCACACACAGGRGAGCAQKFSRMGLTDKRDTKAEIARKNTEAAWKNHETETERADM